MNKKLKLFVVGALLISGCNSNNNFEPEKEILKENIIEESVVKEEVKTEILKQPVIYNNVVDGLLNEENEFDLNTYYMILNETNKKVGDKMIPTYIVIHNTANRAPAINEAKYLNSSSNTSSTSFHFAVDDESVYQTVNMNYNSWHAGNITMNKKSIGIEIAKSTISDTNIKDKAIDNGAKLTAMLMKHYNIPLDRVITHNDVTGKDCPHDILHRYGFDNFKELIKSYLN